MMRLPPIPTFDARGLLPPSDYQVTFQDIRQSHLITGAGHGPTWDTAWRSTLLDGCEVMVRQLWQVGITSIVLDGSFVEDKDHPSDIDGYFDCDIYTLASIVAQLNALDFHQIWTWRPDSRRFDPTTGKDQLPMWHQYRTELYPNTQQQSGILDRYGQPLLFPSAFRQQRGSFAQKGVLLISPGGTS